MATSSILPLISPQALKPALGIRVETLMLHPLLHLRHGKNTQSSIVWTTVTLLSSLLRGKLSRADEIAENKAATEPAEAIHTIATRQLCDPAAPTMSIIRTLTQLGCTVTPSRHGGDRDMTALNEASGRPV